jgi:hypothetical protein
MSPEPYVRAQAGALGLALLVVALQGPAVAALICTGVTAAVAGVLYLRYRGDLRAARVDVVPQHRERLDLIVAGDVRAALAAGAVAGGLMFILSVEQPDLGIAPASAVLLGATAAVILLSSLVDWYVILPRISGLLGIRPCREPDTDFRRRPQTWREVTRWWYVHRIIAALVLRFGLSFAISLTVSQHVDLPFGASIVAGAAVGFLAAYVAAVRKAAWQAGHPSLIVGRTVRRRSVERVPRMITVLGRRVKLPYLTRAEVGETRPREYVYDVSLEAVQLAAAAKYEGEGVPRYDKDGKMIFERDPAKVLVRDVEASGPEPDEPFAGCDGRCSGINWYCIENPRCFATK